ncbi:cytochrome c peroxidase [Mannheimia sp. AT1]|uniref:Cytochrome c peroxidase n=1 Tax=Mannheimia cairinae TaxID=3025936 RepID=A0ABT5MPB0_9PAST|nr:cytochrome c peroxidase [Mannheimia cairinae]MDD0823329.1 cytochrome c peroxidase [Mannheimia cairinae]MDD0827063.1 cytochrome c peroxidase [Mannheimia cairinae]
MAKLPIFLSLFLLSNIGFTLEKEPRTMPARGMDKPLLGQILFFDNMLSLHGSQNCSSCHNPDKAFIDDRNTPANGIVSQGDDPTKYGKRNSPTMLYAKYSPDFHFDEQTKEYIGGQFWDGRAKNLKEQAGMPPIDPNEMGMPSKLEVAKRLYSLPMYQRFLSQFYGAEVWNSYESVYAAMEDAIATFQHEKKLLAPFDSKYDLYLSGKATLSELEEKGRKLFFDKSQTNCSSCHQLQSNANHKEETFTNYHYYNLGVPSNPKLIEINQFEPDFVDFGLFENPYVKGDEKQKGKFKTPTLRNVAVTAPYMHNGVFKNLKTVLLFLDSYNNPARKINPETGKPWERAEFEPTIAHEKLKAKPLTDDDIQALEAFLNTLTDERYQKIKP